MIYILFYFKLFLYKIGIIQDFRCYNFRRMALRGSYLRSKRVYGVTW